MVGGWWCIITPKARQAHVDWRIWRAEHTCTLLATTGNDSSQHDVVTVSESHSDINKPLESNRIKSNQIKTYKFKLTKKKLILQAWPIRHHQLLTRPQFLLFERRAADRTPSKSISNIGLSNRSSRTDTFFSIQTLPREHITSVFLFEACI